MQRWRRRAMAVVLGRGLGSALPLPAHASPDRRRVISVVALAAGTVITDLTFACSPGFVVGGVV